MGSHPLHEVRGKESVSRKCVRCEIPLGEAEGLKWGCSYICGTCRKAYGREWRAAHPPSDATRLRRNEEQRQRFARNPEKRREIQKRWREMHPEKARNAERNWKQAHPLSVKFHHHRDHAKARGMLPVKFAINTPFPRSHLHHLDEKVGVWIPEGLHRSVRHNLRTGQGMVKLGDAIANWMDGKMLEVMR